MPPRPPGPPGRPPPPPGRPAKPPPPPGAPPPGRPANRHRHRDHRERHRDDRSATTSRTLTGATDRCAVGHHARVRTRTAGTGTAGAGGRRAAALRTGHSLAGSKGVVARTGSRRGFPTLAGFATARGRPPRGMPWLGANGLLPGRGAPGRGAGRGVSPPPSRAAGASGVTAAGAVDNRMGGEAGELTTAASGSLGRRSNGRRATGSMTGAQDGPQGQPDRSGAPERRAWLPSFGAAGLLATAVAALALRRAGRRRQPALWGTSRESCGPQGARWSRKPTGRTRPVLSNDRAKSCSRLRALSRARRPGP